MRLVPSVLLLCFALTVTHAAGGGGDEENVNEADVVVLTDKNFDDQVNAEELMLVEFYAPWCGHCKHLKPAYAEAATILKSHDPPIPLAKVDSTVETKVSSRFGVSGYPTLKVFRHGKASEYGGPRDVDGIVKYMKKQVGPAAKPLSSVKEVEAFVSSDPDVGYAVVGFFPEAKTSQLSSSFAIVANKFREKYVFGKVTDVSVCKHYGVESDSIMAFKTYDDLKTVYDGSSKTKEVEDWIQFNAFPVVGEITKAKRDLYRARGLPVAKAFFPIDPANAKQTNYYANRLKKLAIKYKNKILFGMINIKSSDAEGELDQLGRKSEKEFLFAIEDSPNQKNYLFEETFNQANLEKFVDDFVEGRLSAHVRSEKAPAKPEGPGAVRTVVGKNFESIVNDPTKDVMIEFYAPWCGHCKSLAPKYDQLAAKFKDHDSVVVAKIDATANDFDRSKFEVKGYPTIFFVPAKQNAKPIVYEGDREVADMAKFIKKKAINKPWKGSE